MLYAGLDIHKSFSQAILKTETGAILRGGKIATTKEGIEGFFKGITEGKVAIESTGIWEPVYEHLENLGLDARLAHPLKTKAIAYAKIKTDKIDAETLADLLRADLLPESYVPPKEIREVRNLCREHKNIVDDRTKWKNRLSAELSRRGIIPPRDVGNVYTKHGKKWLRSLKISKINRIISIIEFVDKQVKKVDEIIKERAVRNPDIMRLTTIPGIGIYSATFIYAEIGEIDRFPHYENTCSYAGLIPSTHQSGCYTRHGSITKEGSRYLRWILTECAQIHVMRYNTKLTKFYKRLCAKKGNQKAITATARKLLIIIYSMLKNKEPYREEG